MKCIFCSKDIEKGRGTKLVRRDGKILNFCSLKCEKNKLKLKRNPNKRKWSRRIEE